MEALTRQVVFVIEGMLMLESRQSALRCSVRALLACGALCYSALAPALGLGEITVHSALNQTFSADIALLDAEGLVEGELSVRLATPEEFNRAGVERVFFLNDLRFTPIVRGNRSVIRVVSSKPVNEPFLSFLVQANQPNGQLLREYTVLIDPPGSAGIVPSTDPAIDLAVSRAQTTSAFPQVVPAGPSPSVGQGKRYTVAKGDTLWRIAKRLHDAGSPASINELQQVIRTLNPDIEPLVAGRTVLLPDAAALPAPVPPVPVTPPTATPAVSEAQAEALAASTLQNEQLQKTLDELQGRLHTQDDEIASQHKQIIELRTQLAEARTPPAEPEVAAAPPTIAPVVPVAQNDESGGSNLLLIAGLLALGLLLLLGFVMRRRQQRQVLQEPLSVRSTPTVSPSPAVVESPSPVYREATHGTDVLEEVGIYMTYGRFAEAADLLREALHKEPQRSDLKLQLLDVLGKQGDVDAYVAQEHDLLESGFSAQALAGIRALHPKLAATDPAPALSIAKPVAPGPAPVVNDATPDEFQLNLDDLSMDSSWDLVSPFEPSTSDPDSLHTQGAGMASGSSEFSDAPSEDTLAGSQIEWSVASSPALSDDEFLDGFKDPDDPLVLEPLSIAFDEPTAQPPFAGKLEQAQTCIDDGDLDSASRLLNELLKDGDEPLKQTARSLLASIR